MGYKKQSITAWLRRFFVKTLEQSFFRPPFVPCYSTKNYIENPLKFFGNCKNIAIEVFFSLFKLRSINHTAWCLCSFLLHEIATFFCEPLKNSLTIFFIQPKKLLLTISYAHFNEILRLFFSFIVEWIATWMQFFSSS